MGKKKHRCAVCNKRIKKKGVKAFGKHFHKEHFQCCVCQKVVGKKQYIERDGKPYCAKDYRDCFWPKCALCNDAIEEGVTALGKNFHKEHFQCGYCNRELYQQVFYENDGIAYCEEDYIKYISPVCAACNGDITDIKNSVRALGNNFHKEHFQCGYCEKQLSQEAFYENDGVPYCETDYHNYILPTCAHCNDSIIAPSEGVTALGKYFHKEHFLCGYCHEELFQQVFYEKDGVPYCEKDYNKYISPTCAVCNGDIKSLKRCVSALGKTFHKEHFKCGYCKKKLKQKAFYEKDGVPYCEKDYNEHISPTCALCNCSIKDIKVNSVKAFGKIFHKKHFQCGYCHQKLSQTNFHEHNGIPYCEKDYNKYISPTCAVCNVVIEDIENSVRALGQNFHKEHFQCGYCHEELDKNIFYEKDGIPYCEKDYNKYISPICSLCNLVIEDIAKSVRALGKNFHKKHFQCGYCHEKLNKKAFFEKDGIPYCENDYYKYISPTCAFCNVVIEDTTNSVRALGNNFHKEHFQCGYCHQELNQNLFYEKDGVPYCEIDYFNYISPICAFCNDAIIDNANSGVRALGKNFHKDHFQCGYCHEVLKQHLFFEKDGVPYCERDYYTYISPTCAFCNGFIKDTTNIVRALGKTFHKKHFQCGYCQQELSEEVFYEKDGIPYCKEDYNNHIFPTCYHCSDYVDPSEGVKAAGKTFHKEHFQCIRCHQVLKQVYFEQDGLFYCEVDYNKLIYPKCARCKRPVKDGVTAFGKSYHRQHFQCGYCYQVITDKVFYEKDGVPYCEADFKNNILQKCGTCKEVIFIGVASVTAFGKNFHKAHFICSLCQEELEPESAYEKNGLFYCEVDYHNFFKPKCARCNGAIIDNCLTALGKSWHPDHFVCHKCNILLDEKNFFAKDGKAYCKEDYQTPCPLKCTCCTRIISKEYILGRNRIFHPKCFRTSRDEN